MLKAKLPFFAHFFAVVLHDYNVNLPSHMFYMEDGEKLKTFFERKDDIFLWCDYVNIFVTVCLLFQTIYLTKLQSLRRKMSPTKNNFFPNVMPAPFPGPDAQYRFLVEVQRMLQ